jgi:hypothetical protein
MANTSSSVPAQFRNHAKVTWRSKFRQVGILLGENGAAWTSMFLGYCASQATADKLNAWLERSRKPEGYLGLLGLAAAG